MPKSEYNIAQKVIECHVNAAGWVESLSIDVVSRGCWSSRHWKTAYRVAQKSKRLQYFSSLLPNLRESIQLFIEDAPLWALELLTIEVTLEKGKRDQRNGFVSDERLENILILLDHLEEPLYEKGLMQRKFDRFLGLTMLVEKLLKKDVSHKGCKFFRAAEILEKIAIRLTLPVHKMVFWRDVAHLYDRAGARDKRNEALKNARTFTQQFNYMQNENKVLTQIAVSLDEVNTYLAPILGNTKNINTVLDRLSGNIFLSDLDKISKKSLVIAQSPSRQIALEVPIIDDRLLKGVTLNEVVENEEHKSLKFEILWTENIDLKVVFSRLHQEYGLTKENLFLFLSSSPHLRGQDLPFIACVIA